ncbi:MAG TPA: hypothetical protein VNA14_08915 [Mycobacteriales bacterium]|nr:hypothetical protein [Mycobacteriales bacterium]
MRLPSRMRFITITAMACLASALAAPGSAGPDGGSFDVTAAPLGAPYVSPVGCESGVEGVHKATKVLDSPALGLLFIDLDAHPGDWDVGVYDDVTDEYIGYGGYNSHLTSGDGERVVARAKAGQRIRLVVCNYFSTEHTVTVRYRFTRGLVPPRTKATRGFAHLAAGAPADLREKVPVNVVLVGYQPRDVAAKALIARLPKVNRPIERGPQWYGYHRPVGITYTYDYRVTHADSTWTNRFFSHLRSIAEEAPLSVAQRAYNDQKSAVRDITRNFEIDGPAVERYLAMSPPRGVDTRRNTVFLVNWWGRKDFVDHVYTKAGEPNSDTGEDLGQSQSSYRLVAWGGSAYDDPETGLGTPRRVWFHDLSAGPEQWTRSGLVDTPDLDGDGEKERRFPPAWEYFADGAAKRHDLARDLGDLVRYVAINLLFTSSPLYPVALTPPALPRTVDIDLNRYEHDSVARPLKDFLDVAEIQRNVAKLLRGTKVSLDDQALDVRSPSHLACYAQTLSAYQGAFAPACSRSDRYSVYSNPFVDEMTHRDRFIDDAGEVDYEAPVFLYGLTDRTSPADSCFAYADDNQRDGVQSQIVAYLPAWCRRSVGATEFTLHELGHHFSLSHPHDGYDYETGVDYYAWGKFFFVGLGDESSSVMSYMWINNEFSQFDYDNYDRFTTAANVAAAQQVAADVLRSARAGSGRRALQAADAALGRTSALFAAHQYAEAAKASRAAYAAVRAAAKAAGVTVTGSTKGWSVDSSAGPAVPLPRERGYAAVDRIEVGPDGSPYYSQLLGKVLTPMGPVDPGSALANSAHLGAPAVTAAGRS